MDRGRRLGRRRARPGRTPVSRGSGLAREKGLPVGVYRAAPYLVNDPIGPASRQSSYFTGFHVPHPSDVNIPSEDRTVTVISLAAEAKLLAMISPDRVNRSQ